MLSPSTDLWLTKHSEQRWDFLLIVAHHAGSCCPKRVQEISLQHKKRPRKSKTHAHNIVCPSISWAALDLFIFLPATQLLSAKPFAFGKIANVREKENKRLVRKNMIRLFNNAVAFFRNSSSLTRNAAVLGVSAKFLILIGSAVQMGTIFIIVLLR